MKSTDIRFTSLDALRGIAAFSIMISHYTHVYNVFYPYEYEDYFSWEIGGRAVELFFILSGFVIFFSIQNIDSPKEFLLKRFIRLYPTYWICMIMTFSVVQIFGLPKLEVSWEEAVIGLTMVPQVFGAQKVDYSYWTLVPELFFYLSIAVIIYFKAIERILDIGFFWLLLSIIHGYLYHIKGLGLILLLDYFPYFFSGILFYKLKQNNKSLKVWLLLLISCIAGIGHYINKIEEACLIMVIYFLYLVFVVRGLQILENKVLLFLGRISYALYLVHQFFGYVILNYIRGYFDTIAVIIIPSIASLVLASIITFYMERPIINFLKKKLIMNYSS